MPVLPYYRTSKSRTISRGISSTMASDMAAFSLEPSSSPISERFPFLGSFRDTHSYQFLSGRSFLTNFRFIIFAMSMVAVFAAIGIFAFVLVGSHSHKVRQDDANNDVLGAAMDTEALLLPGAALRQQIGDGHVEGSRKPVKLVPTLEVIDGTDVIWQIPRKRSAAVFFAHGCGQAATMFWDQAPNCTRCSGMPEDRALTQAALRRGFAVIAIKSHGSCWESRWPPETSKDVEKVAKILKDWQKKKRLESLPLAALGASSGGYFITVLAHKMKFSSLAIYISSGVKKAFVKDLPNGEKYPPTLFVHMPRDKKTAGDVTGAIKVLNKNGVQSAELKCHPLPITPAFFTERIVGLNKTVSEKIYGTLKLEKYLDKDDYLIQDPRRSPWSKALAKHEVLPSMENGEKSFTREISEELNLAYAMHELTSLKAPETFDWFKNRCWLKGQYRHHRCRNFEDPVIVR